MRNSNSGLTEPLLSEGGDVSGQSIYDVEIDDSSSSQPEPASTSSHLIQGADSSQQSSEPSVLTSVLGMLMALGIFGLGIGDVLLKKGIYEDLRKHYPRNQRLLFNAYDWFDVLTIATLFFFATYQIALVLMRHKKLAKTVKMSREKGLELELVKREKAEVTDEMTALNEQIAVLERNKVALNAQIGSLAVAEEVLTKRAEKALGVANRRAQNAEEAFVVLRDELGLNKGSSNEEVTAVVKKLTDLERQNKEKDAFVLKFYIMNELKGTHDTEKVSNIAAVLGLASNFTSDQIMRVLERRRLINSIVEKISTGQDSQVLLKIAKLLNINPDAVKTLGFKSFLTKEQLELAEATECNRRVLRSLNEEKTRFEEQTKELMVQNDQLLVKLAGKRAELKKLDQQKEELLATVDKIKPEVELLGLQLLANNFAKEGRFKEGGNELKDVYIKRLEGLRICEDSTKTIEAELEPKRRELDALNEEMGEKASLLDQLEARLRFAQNALAHADNDRQEPMAAQSGYKGRVSLEDCYEARNRAAGAMAPQAFRAGSRVVNVTRLVSSVPDRLCDTGHQQGDQKQGRRCVSVPPPQVTVGGVMRSAAEDRKGQTVVIQTSTGTVGGNPSLISRAQLESLATGIFHPPQGHGQKQARGLSSSSSGGSFGRQDPFRR